MENFGSSGALISGALNSGSAGVGGALTSGAAGGEAEPPKSGKEKLKLGGEAGAAFGVGLLLAPCSWTILGLTTMSAWWLLLLRYRDAAYRLNALVSDAYSRSHTA
jgi:hypothetical protein